MLRWTCRRVKVDVQRHWKAGILEGKCSIRPETMLSRGHFLPYSNLKCTSEGIPASLKSLALGVIYSTQSIVRDVIPLVNNTATMVASRDRNDDA